MKRVAVSGYFLYPHVGHIRLITAARALGDQVVVIVNNDHQQVLKYGRVIVPQDARMEVMRALRLVDDVFLSIDEDRTVRASLGQLRPDIFANGGDRDEGNIPEVSVCRRYGIEMVFSVGGEKADSSSRILQELG